MKHRTFRIAQIVSLVVLLALLPRRGILSDFGA